MKSVTIKVTPAEAQMLYEAMIAEGSAWLRRASEAETQDGYKTRIRIFHRTEELARKMAKFAPHNRPGAEA